MTELKVVITQEMIDTYKRVLDELRVIPTLTPEQQEQYQIEIQKIIDEAKLKSPLTPECLNPQERNK
jgi:hypothetical protein